MKHSIQLLAKKIIFSSALVLLFNFSDASAQVITLEAENAKISGAVITREHSGYSGTGFVDFINKSGDYIEFTVNIELAGTYDFDFRYALGIASGARPLNISVNGNSIASYYPFGSTGSWSTWVTTGDVGGTLVKGINTIRITATGYSGPNVDYLRLEKQN